MEKHTKKILILVAIIVITGFLYEGCNIGQNKLAVTELVEDYSKQTSDSIKLRCAEFFQENMKDITSDVPIFYNPTTGQEKKIQLNEISSEQALHKLLKKYNLVYKTSAISDGALLDKKLLTDNIEQAVSTRNRYPWNKNIPDEIFYNYLLPYKVLFEKAEDWRSFFVLKYRNLVNGRLNKYYLDTTDNRLKDPNDLYYQVIVNDAGFWFHYDDQFTRLARAPSLSELLCIKKGNCLQAAYLNVYILRALGIPATIDIVPFWGSQNGSHASEVFWDGCEKMRAPGGRAFKNPAKVIRMTFKKQGMWSDSLKSYVKNGKFLLPFLCNDHWQDVTNEHSKVMTVAISLRHHADSKFAYICVYSYGNWHPVFWGKVENDVATFSKMSYPMLYQIAVPDGDGFKLEGRVFAINRIGKMSYPQPNAAIKLSMILHRTTSKLYVKKGHSYSLMVLKKDNKWELLKEKRCNRDSCLEFTNINSRGLLRLLDNTEKGNAERIFSYENNEQVLW